MAELVFDKPGVQVADLTGSPQLVINTSGPNICIEDFSGKLKDWMGKKLGNRYFLFNENPRLLLKFFQKKGEVVCEKASTGEVSHLRYKVFTPKKYTEIRLCETTAYCLEFDKDLKNDPENRSPADCDRVVKFDLKSPDYRCIVGFVAQNGRLSIRFYY